MGVPAFFRWLSRKYPSVIVFCQEEKPKEVDGQYIPVDGSLPNPNGVEFDNLYLDMNGIIHPCTHPEDRPAPRDEDEMMVAIFQCIDRLMSIVRPRKLLYMAIDGVAPRAKMNQQRSRRFRASKETAEKAAEMERRRQELMDKGAFLPPPRQSEGHFDSNCITPGTPFMDRLATALHYYIHDRLSNNPGWRGIKVLLSDANVPGEGEHKIMDFIRRQRAQPDHDPNTQHVLCGADADLIMLGLATHEPNFTIIREEFRPNKPRPCDLCSQPGHEMKDCVGCPKPVDGSEVPVPVFGDEVPFIFVRLSVLREYLERELVMPGLPFKYDFERAVDDWVFMCFFVGNDFLPHLPSLEIREGAIDRLVNLYKNAVYRTGGFVTDSGLVNLARVQIILSELGQVEDEIFKKRQQTELMFRQREKNKKRQAAMDLKGKPAFMPDGQFAPQPVLSRGGDGPQLVIQHARLEAARGRVNAMQYSTNASGSADQNGAGGIKRKAEDLEEEEEEDPDAHDEVRLWEDGFKDRYYESKFDVSSDNIPFRIRVAHEYVRGLCWVLKYYYQGCASWKWYFPYHYAPFASDFVNIAEVDVEFDRDTEPFEPLQQLMSVFPAASSSHVPEPWAKLMHDPFSPIIDFYPTDFKIDLNGKKFAWQGVALLPFVDECRLFEALKSLYDELTPEEKRRNRLGTDRMYSSPTSDIHSFLKGFEDDSSLSDGVEIAVGRIRGRIAPSGRWSIPEGGDLSSPVRGLPAIRENRIICVSYHDPIYPVGFIFAAKRLKGVVEPAKVLKPLDLSAEESRNWRPQLGMARATTRAEFPREANRMLGHFTRAADYHNRSLPPPRQYPTDPAGIACGSGHYANVAPPGGGYHNRDRWQSGQNTSYNSYYQSGGNSYNNRSGQHQPHSNHFQHPRRNDYNPGRRNDYDNSYNNSNNHQSRYNSRYNDKNNQYNNPNNPSRFNNSQGPYGDRRNSYNNRR